MATFVMGVTPAEFVAPDKKEGDKVLEVYIGPNGFGKTTKLNNIKNVHFYCDDATRFINNLAMKKERIDVVIMDPPRKGSDASFLNAVLKLKPRKVIYISCDPHTQINDLKHLVKDYKIIYIQPVDMFPQTEHIENIVTLERK